MNNNRSPSQLQRQQSQKRRDQLFALLKSDVIRMKSGKRIRLKKLDSRARHAAVGDDAANLEKAARAVNTTGQLLAPGQRKSRQCTADEIQCSDQNQQRHQQSSVGDAVHAPAVKRRRRHASVELADENDGDRDRGNGDDEYDSDSDEEDEEAPIVAPTPKQSLVLFDSQISIANRRYNYNHHVSNSPVL